MATKKCCNKCDWYNKTNIKSWQLFSWFRVHKIPQSCCIQYQMNPSTTFTLNFCVIHLKFIHPSSPPTSDWNSIRPYLPHAGYISYPRPLQILGDVNNDSVFCRTSPDQWKRITSHRTQLNCRHLESLHSIWSNEREKIYKIQKKFCHYAIVRTE
jgi:hypothetical protein